MESVGVSRPTVSVIVPLYNVADYVADAIRSLKRQAFRDFEVIMVDDGSTDATADVVRSLVEGDDRFMLIGQENAGPASARNRGLDEARGDYLMFLDADDSYADEALETLVERALADDLDYLDFSARTVYEDERLRAVRDESFYEGRSDIEGVMSGPELFCAFQRKREYVCALWLHFVKRELVVESGLRLRDGMYVHEDELFSPLLIACAERAAFLNEPLYLRRVRADSAMTAGRGMRNVVSMHDAAQGLYSWLRDNGSRFDGSFRAAWAQRIAELHELAAEDARHVPIDELVAYSEGLPPAEQLDFELAVVQGMLRRSEFYGSTTWRVGEAMLAVPNAVRRMADGGPAL